MLELSKARVSEVLIFFDFLGTQNFDVGFTLGLPDKNFNVSEKSVNIKLSVVLSGAGTTDQAKDQEVLSIAPGVDYFDIREDSCLQFCNNNYGSCVTDVCGLRGYCCSPTATNNDCPTAAISAASSKSGDFCVEPKNKCSTCWKTGFTREDHCKYSGLSFSTISLSWEDCLKECSGSGYISS